MPGLFGMNIIATVLIIGGILLVSGVKILKEYERAVIFRLGRMVDPRGPGIIYVIPLIERMLRVPILPANKNLSARIQLHPDLPNFPHQPRHT